MRYWLIVEFLEDSCFNLVIQPSRHRNSFVSSKHRNSTNISIDSCFWWNAIWILLFSFVGAVKQLENFTLEPNVRTRLFEESIMGKLSPVDSIKWVLEWKEAEIQFTIQKWTINGTIGEANYRRFIIAEKKMLCDVALVSYHRFRRNRK